MTSAGRPRCPYVCQRKDLNRRGSIIGAPPEVNGWAVKVGECQVSDVFGVGKLRSRKIGNVNRQAFLRCVAGSPDEMDVLQTYPGYGGIVDLGKYNEVLRRGCRGNGRVIRSRAENAEVGAQNDLRCGEVEWPEDERNGNGV